MIVTHSVGTTVGTHSVGTRSYFIRDSQSHFLPLEIKGHQNRLRICKSRFVDIYKEVTQVVVLNDYD